MVDYGFGFDEEWPEVIPVCNSFQEFRSSVKAKLGQNFGEFDLFIQDNLKVLKHSTYQEFKSNLNPSNTIVIARKKNYSK
jgi:hypothetical protein